MISPSSCTAPPSPSPPGGGGPLKEVLIGGTVAAFRHEEDAIDLCEEKRLGCSESDFAPVVEEKQYNIAF